jgi:hypothetical protein
MKLRYSLTWSILTCACAFFCSFFFARRIWFLDILGAIVTAEGITPGLSVYRVTTKKTRSPSYRAAGVNKSTIAKQVSCLRDWLSWCSKSKVQAQVAILARNLPPKFPRACGLVSKCPIITIYVSQLRTPCTFCSIFTAADYLPECCDKYDITIWVLKSHISS